jgi:dihydrofolate reductase
MSKVVIDMSMSLDGFVAGPDDNPGQLHNWLFTGDTENRFDPMFRTSGGSTLVLDEIFEAGAILVGRRMLDLAGAWGGRSPIRNAPVFVLTRKPPTEYEFDGSPFTFVTDGIERAVERAVRAAGAKMVYIAGGATIAQQALSTGLADEIQIHLAPVLFGEGVHLFDGVAPEGAVRLEQTRVIEAPGITHLLFRVLG